MGSPVRQRRPGKGLEHPGLCPAAQAQSNQPRTSDRLPRRRASCQAATKCRRRSSRHGSGSRSRGAPAEPCKPPMGCCSRMRVFCMEKRRPLAPAASTAVAVPPTMPKATVETGALMARIVSRIDTTA